MSRNHVDRVVSMRRVLDAPCEKVFAALTRPDMLRHWMCPAGFSVPAVETDLRVGGRFRIEMRAPGGAPCSPEGAVYTATGIYQEIRAPELLVYTWTWEPGHTMAGVETVIRVELSAQGSKTLLVMTHSGLPNEAERAGHEQGWSGAYDKLVALFTQRSDP